MAEKWVYLIELGWSQQEKGIHLPSELGEVLKKRGSLLRGTKEARREKTMIPKRAGTISLNCLGEDTGT